MSATWREAHSRCRVSSFEATTEPSHAAGADDPIVLTPAQALRVYKPGTQLSYAYEIYNATTPVQSTTRIWRGTEKVLWAPPATLLVPPGGDRRVAAARAEKRGALLHPRIHGIKVSAHT